MYYAEIKDGIVVAILQTDTEMPYPVHIEIDSHDTTLLFADYDEVTGEFIRPTAPTHKTSGIDKAQWFDQFTPVEQIKISELKAKIEDEAFMAAKLNAALAVGGYITTYRASMRAFFAAWDAAPSISVKHPSIYPSLQLLVYLDILDDAGRPDVLIQGVPL